MIQPVTLIEREAARDKKNQHLLWLRSFEVTVAAANFTKWTLSVVVNEAGSVVEVSVEMLLTQQLLLLLLLF